MEELIQMINSKVEKERDEFKKQEIKKGAEYLFDKAFSISERSEIFDFFKNNGLNSVTRRILTGTQDKELCLKGLKKMNKCDYLVACIYDEFIYKSEFLTMLDIENIIELITKLFFKGEE